MGASPYFLENFAGSGTGRDRILGAVLRRQVWMVVVVSGIFIPQLLVVVDTLLPSV